VAVGVYRALGGKQHQSRADALAQLCAINNVIYFTGRGGRNGRGKLILPLLLQLLTRGGLRYLVVLGKGNGRRVFGTAKVGDRGQIVIPKEARELFNIQPGDTLLILGEEETGLIVSRPEVLSDLASKIFDQVQKED
jgi:AbrB family looped-hinge helix DNA binding protein